MKVKFSRCTSSNLANVPQVDGQLIYIKDTNEIYMDVGNSRTKISEILTVADKSSLLTPLQSKIYYETETEKLYKYDGTNWINLSGVNSEEVLTLTNTTQFTPTADYHPATKKYVDDSNAITIMMNASIYSLTTSSSEATVLNAFGGEENYKLLEYAARNGKQLVLMYKGTWAGSGLSYSVDIPVGMGFSTNVPSATSTGTTSITFESLEYAGWNGNTMLHVTKTTTFVFASFEDGPSVTDISVTSNSVDKPLVYYLSKKIDDLTVSSTASEVAEAINLNEVVELVGMYNSGTHPYEPKNTPRFVFSESKDIYSPTTLYNVIGVMPDTISPTGNRERLIIQYLTATNKLITLKFNVTAGTLVSREETDLTGNTAIQQANNYTDEKIGAINTILDSINGEVV